MIMRDHITAKERLKKPMVFNIDQIVEDVIAAFGFIAIFYIFLIVATN